MFTILELLRMLRDGGRGELILALEKIPFDHVPWPSERVERLIDSLRGNVLEPWKVKEIREFNMHRHAYSFRVEGLEIDLFSYYDSNTFAAYCVRKGEEVLYFLVNPDIEHSCNWQNKQLQRKLPA